MRATYRKITDEEDKMRNLFEKGEYPFTIKTCTAKRCKNGINQMFVIEASYTNHEGRSNLITDWVILDMEGMEWKLRHLAATCGLLDKYEADTLEDVDFVNKRGTGKLTKSTSSKVSATYLSNRPQ